MPTRNKTAGNKWELDFIEMVKLHGVAPYAVSSRSESRNRDNQKIDVINKDEWRWGRIPHDWQCKNTTNISPHKLIEESPRKDRYVIVHKKTKKVNKRFTTVGHYAYMTLKCYMTMCKTIKILLYKVKRQDKKIKSLENELNIMRLKNAGLLDELNKQLNK